MILVTGASGNVGGAVLSALAAGDEQVRAVVRPGSSAALPASAERAEADINDRADLRSTFGGVDAAFLMAGYDDLPGMLADMGEAGVQRVVLLSSGAVAGGDPENAVVALNLESEAAVRGSGLGWTILRPSGFMSNTLQWVPQLRDGDVVREPFADVPIAVIDPDDIGAVAATVLVSGAHAQQTYRLTGPAALLPADRAEILGEVLGRRIELVAEADENARRRMGEAMAPETVDAFFQFFRRGGYDDSRTNSVAPDLLGRPLRTFRAWAESHADSFAGPNH